MSILKKILREIRRAVGKLFGFTDKPKPQPAPQPAPTPTPTPTPQPTPCNIDVPPLSGTSRGNVFFKRCNGSTTFKVVYYCLRGDTNTIGYTNDHSEKLISKGWVANHVFVAEYTASANATVSGVAKFPEVTVPLPVSEVR